MPKRRKNPSTVNDAKKFFEDFHWGTKGKKVKAVTFPEVPEYATEIGELVAIAYKTEKGGEHATWEHEFGETGKERPSLVVDPETKRLHIVGGKYTVTERGIED